LTTAQVPEHPSLTAASGRARDAGAMSGAEPSAGRRIVRLVGVYDADHTLRGEVSYWIGARLGRRHCSLCDITHSSVRQRPEWRACVAGLPVQFETFHRDDQPDAVRLAADGRAPVVVVETDQGHELLLDQAALDECAGSIDRLVAAIERAADRAGLRWVPL
jgi:hypothetical protein